MSLKSKLPTFINSAHPIGARENIRDVPKMHENGGENGT